MFGKGYVNKHEKGSFHLIIILKYRVNLLRSNFLGPDQSKRLGKIVLEIHGYYRVPVYITFTGYEWTRCSDRRFD